MNALLNIHPALSGTTLNTQRRSICIGSWKLNTCPAPSGIISPPLDVECWMLNVECFLFSLKEAIT
jgi:hypothetical protein